MSGSRRRNRTRRRQQTEHGSGALVEQLWSQLVHPAVIGGVFLAAGVLALVAPFLKLPARKSFDFFAQPVQATDALQIVILLVVGASVLGAGALVQSWLSGQGRKGFGALRFAALGSAGLGIIGLVASWLSLQTDVPATQAYFGLGQQVEHVVGKVRGKAVKIMLPQRVKVVSLDQNSEGQALLKMELTRPKQREVEPTPLQVGESITVDQTRFTFVGTGADVQQLRAILVGAGEQSIEAVARKGGTVRVTLDGPEYDVMDISLNYMGMGPAVQLESEETGAFWVFARAGKDQVFSQKLRMLRVENMPAAVMTVGPARPFEPLVASGLLLVLGLGGLMLLGSGHTRGSREDDASHEEEA